MLGDRLTRLLVNFNGRLHRKFLLEVDTVVAYELCLRVNLLFAAAPQSLHLFSILMMNVGRAQDSQFKLVRLRWVAFFIALIRGHATSRNLQRFM